MTYIDWEYYGSLFTDADKENFSKLEKRAEIKLDAVTHMRAKVFMTGYDENTATEFQRRVREQIKITMCELINMIATQDSAGMGTGIASVSNDGYAESYKVTTVAEKEAQLVSVIKNGLSGTGLAGAL